MSDMEENILSRIGGEYVSAAIKALGNAEKASDHFQESVIEVPGIGKVCFTCKRMNSRNRKFGYAFWRAIAAVKVD